jgi:hypothetical protein
VRPTQASGDVFDDVPPPFDLVSDMLLTGATCPVGPLRKSFPDVPFLALGDRAVVGMWFSRVLSARVGPGGERELTPASDPHDFPYAELTVAVLVRGGHAFVPGIYATGELTLRIGHRYGMPKVLVPMTYEASDRAVRSVAWVRGGESRVAARVLASGRLLAALLDRAFPRWSPIVSFPSGSNVQARLERAERVHLTWIDSGRLALDEPWLPRAVALWRLALHVPRQRMVLPAPPSGADGRA